MHTDPLPPDCDELFIELYYDVDIDPDKFDLFLIKIEKLINDGVVLPRMWYKNWWHNILDSLSQPHPKPPSSG